MSDLLGKILLLIDDHGQSIRQSEDLIQHLNDNLDAQLKNNDQACGFNLDYQMRSNKSNDPTQKDDFNDLHEMEKQRIKVSDLNSKENVNKTENDVQELNEMENQRKKVSNLNSKENVVEELNEMEKQRIKVTNLNRLDQVDSESDRYNTLQKMDYQKIRIDNLYYVDRSISKPARFDDLTEIENQRIIVNNLNVKDQLYKALVEQIKQVVNSKDHAVLASGPISELIKYISHLFLSSTLNPTEKSDAEIMEFIAKYDKDITNFIETECKRTLMSCLTDRVRSETVRGDVHAPVVNDLPKVSASANVIREPDPKSTSETFDVILESAGSDTQEEGSKYTASKISISNEAAPRPSTLKRLSTEESTTMQQGLKPLSSEEATPMQHGLKPLSSKDATPMQPGLKPLPAEELPDKESTLKRLTSEKSQPKPSNSNRIPSDKPVPKQSNLLHLPSNDKVSKHSIPKHSTSAVPHKKLSSKKAISKRSASEEVHPKDSTVRDFSKKHPDFKEHVLKSAEHEHPASKEYLNTEPIHKPTGVSRATKPDRDENPTQTYDEGDDFQRLLYLMNIEQERLYTEITMDHIKAVKDVVSRISKGSGELPGIINIVQTKILEEHKNMHGSDYKDISRMNAVMKQSPMLNTAQNDRGVGELMIVLDKALFALEMDLREKVLEKPKVKFLRGK